MRSKKIFVTVGTTKFDKLIDKLSEDELLNILHSLGYTFIQFQVGSSAFNEKKHSKVEISYCPYFENFSEQIENSDLVISHAGAGTCLEVLKQRKPLIVVINEDLMDNHQVELAETLAAEGYLKCCNIIDLRDVLTENKFAQFKPYPSPDSSVFSQYLNKCMGFVTQ